MCQGHNSNEIYSPPTYWDDRLRQRWSLQGVGFINYSNWYNRFLYKGKMRTLRRALRQENISVAGRSVLDLGPGIGFWLRWYLKEGASSVAGLEISTYAAANLAAEIPSACVHNGDIGVPWDFDSKYDVINAFDVMYHVADDRAFKTALVESVHHLRPGGYLLLTDRFADVESRPNAHVCFRTFESYRELLEGEGCSIRGVYPVYRFLNGAFAHEMFATRNRWFRKAMQKLEDLGAPLLYLADAIPIGAPNLYLLVVQRLAA